ncbi:hypothetical protein [Methylobacter sp.]|uniref:hypothetical protein n=1 Tax=Methylobacter sp. TaxID=2051955 RepID=UPI003DA44DE8
MKISSNIAILIAGSLAATTPLFAKDGPDDGMSSSSASATNSTSGDIELKKKVVAGFSDKLLVIPCVDVRNSPFDGHYNVLMSLAGDGSGFDWKLKRAEVTTDPVCDYPLDNEIDTDDVLAAIGMPSVSEFKGKDGTDRTLEVTVDYDLRKKVIISFSNNLLVVPCVDVQQTIFAGHYNVVMERNPNNVEEWKVREAKPTTCDGESAEEINLEITLDEVLQSIDMKK